MKYGFFVSRHGKPRLFASYHLRIDFEKFFTPHKIAKSIFQFVYLKEQILRETLMFENKTDRQNANNEKA